MRRLLLGALAGCACLMSLPNCSLAQWHSIAPVPVDLSRSLGISPDGIPEYWCNAELDISLPGGYSAKVTNPLSTPIANTTVMVPDMYSFFGDPSGWIFLYDVVWNPSALADVSRPAYALGAIAPNGSQTVAVSVIPGFEIFHPVPSFRVLFTSSAPLLFGDADQDGRVDIADLNVLLTNYNKTSMSWTQGEFTGDGAVDTADLNKLLTNYNKTGTSAAGISPVPEPSTLVLGIVAMVLLACSWRRVA